jgi:hypothetical protein
MSPFRRSLATLTIATFTALAPLTSQAGIPKGGLAAITVSHDGKTIYAAGDNRVMYVINAEDMSIKQRVWIELNPYELILSKDGKTLVLHDSSGLLTYLDANTFEKKKTIKDADTISIAHDAGMIVAAGKTKGRNEKAVTSYAVYDIATGNQVRAGKVASSIGAIGTLPDASKVFVMSNSIKSDTEKKEKPPKELKGNERDTFQQKHDEKISHLITLDADGNEIDRKTTWAISGSYAAMNATDSGLKVVNSSNKNLAISADSKEVNLFKTEAFGHYGYTFSKDGSILVSGGLRKGAITNFEKDTSTKFELKRIGGWPEYFEGFAIGPKGNIYGGTSAYRLLKLSPEGETLAEIPVY